MLKGFRTVLFNGLLVVAPVFLHYIAGVDWTQYVSPAHAVTAIAIANLILRGVTNTKIFNTGTSTAEKS